MVVAHIHLMSQIGMRVTLTELADRVGIAFGGGRTFAQSQITEYHKGKVMPPLDVVLAYAKATSVDPGWLAFGSESAAPAPSGFSGVPDAPLTAVDRKSSAKKRSRS
jgi:transcriptional regulator with XRE-family HTH domain